MLLMPKSDWHWKFNHSYSVLGIHLGENIEFLTPYEDKLLIPDAMYDTVFRVEHASFYTNILALLKKHLDQADALMVQIALNATALHFMLSPQMPKSWFFYPSSVCVICEIGRLFELHTVSKRIIVLVVEQSSQAAQVMMLSDTLNLANGKVLKRFDTIKVMRNRLQPMRIDTNTIFAA